VDSVDLALQILDGAYLMDKQVKVERARFTLKGQYDPTKKPKQRKKKDKEKLKKKQEALFAWKPEKLRGERPKCEKVVVLKNAFAPEDFNAQVELILELKEDFREEASKYGTCRRVEIFDVC
jgi:HIV Tat-specific factor 1